MLRIGKKLVAGILCVCMVFCSMPVFAEELVVTVTPNTTPAVIAEVASTEIPTEEPTEELTVESTEEPTDEPTEVPTEAPTDEPTEVPTEAPTDEPTEVPTEAPTVEPTAEPGVLTLTLTSSATYAFAGRDTVTLVATVSGGTAPYVVSMKENDVEIQTVITEVEGSLEMNYTPSVYGEHVIEVTIIDSKNQTASTNVIVMVAESDSETEAEWTAAFANMHLTEDWREDIVAIANTQVGYHESEREFILDDEGAKQGYTRYGDWYGRTYAEWCAMFVSFCANYADIPANYVPWNNSSAEMKEDFANMGVYEDDEDAYIPVKGDLIFFHWVEDGESENNTPEHIGIVESVSNGCVYTIEGNINRSVMRNDYTLADRSIVGYANMTKLMELAGVLGNNEPEPVEGDVIARTTTNGVNVRADATTNSDVVGQVYDAGTELPVLGSKDMGDYVWYQVQYAEVVGYIRGDLLEIVMVEESVDAVQSAVELLTGMTVRYAREYTEETYDAVLVELVSGMDLTVFAEENAALETAMAALTEEELTQFKTGNADALAWLNAVKAQVESVLAAQAAVEAVRAQLTALNVPEYTEETLWTALDEVIAAKQAEEALEAYITEITATLEALNALPEEDKTALETEFAAQLSFAKLLPVKVTFDELVANYYVEFEDELWILFETKLALMDMDELVAAYNDVAAAMSAVYALPEAELALFSEQYGTELDFMTQFYAAINEKAATPMTLASSSSKFDTSVTNGYYNVLSEKDYNVISGVTETEIVMNNSDGTRRQAFRFFSIDPTSSSIELVPGYYQIDKYASDPTNTAYQSTAKVTDMAAYYESELGYDIVGGMNTALAYDSNAPYSFLMWEGTVLQDKNDSFGLGYEWLNQHTGSCSTYIAVKKDGSVELRGGSEPFEEDDWNCVGANFGWLVKDGALVSTTEERTSSAASRSMIGIKADGTLILCQTDGRGANNSVGQSSYEMGEMMLALGCVYAFNCDGGGSSTFISQRAGESGLTMRSTPSDGSERPTIHAIFIAKAKGMIPGIFDYAKINSEYDYFAPYTTYTFAAEAIDTTGAAMTMPEGGVWSLSDDSFGTIVDGTFVSNGTIGEVSVQYSVGGKTAEYAINVVHPDSFSFGADSTVIPYGKSVTLAPTVLYGADDWDVYYQADTFTWTFSDETVGTWDPDALTYTATTDESKNGPVLTVAYKYSTELAAVTYSIEFGKGSEIVAGWDFEDGDVSDWMGFTDAKAWSVANGVNNTLVGSNPLAGQFSPENDAQTFLATADNGQVKNGKYALGITFDNTASAFGNWTYNVLFNVGETRVFRDVANGLNATTLGFWLYIPEGGTGLAFQSQFNASADHTAPSCKQDHFTFITVSGERKNLNSCTEADIPANRWVYASIDIRKYDYLSTMPATDETNSRSPSFIRTYIKPASPAELTFYIDDITLDYSAAVEDRNAPVISNAQYTTADEGVALTDNAEIAGNSIGFTAEIAESTGSGEISGLNLASAKIYIDGNEVEAEATKTTMATKANVELANGQHRVTFEIEDNWYNRTQLSYEFTVAGEEEPLVELSGHNDSGSTPEADSVYYVDINTTAAEDVAIVEANIQLNTANTWELEHMIVAPGFEVEYVRLDDERYSAATYASTTDIYAVDNVVAIVLTRTDDCQLTGEQTLLSIPVRVWSWDGVDNVTGEEASVSSNKPVVTIDYTILFGYVENNDGDVIEFGGSQSIATTMTGQTSDTVYHEHDVVELEDKPAGCIEDGYTGRTYCYGCSSVIEWGETVTASGTHAYELVEGQFTCSACDAVYTMPNGLFAINEKFYYAIAGNLMTGWIAEGADYYYFDETTFEAVDGEQEIGYYHYVFENNILVEGEVVYDANGIAHYIWAGGWKAPGRFSVGDKTYWVKPNWELAVGRVAFSITTNTPLLIMDFDENGVLLDENLNGIIEHEGNIYYVIGSEVQAGIGAIEFEGDIYYIRSSAIAATGKYYVAADKTNDILEEGYYLFGADGKLVKDEWSTEWNGTELHIVNGRPVETQYGLVVIGGDIYYIRSNGQKATGRYYVPEDKLNGILECADDYVFDNQGKFMKEGWSTAWDGTEKYILNGKPATPPYGLLVVQGEIYYIRSNGQKATGLYYVGENRLNGILEKSGYYLFDDDGKLIRE